MKLDAAQQEMVMQNAGLIGFTLHKKLHVFPEDTRYADLYQTGFLTLCRCARGYDPTQTKFATYAVRSMIRELLRELNKMRARGFTPLRFNDAETVSLEAMSDDYEELGIALSYFESPDEGGRIIDDHLGELTERERTVIMRRYYGDETLEQLGQHYGLTKERVRQIQRDGLKKIRRSMEAKGECEV